MKRIECQCCWRSRAIAAMEHSRSGVHPTVVILSGMEWSEGSQALRKIGMLHVAIATLRMTVAKLGCTRGVTHLGVKAQSLDSSLRFAPLGMTNATFKAPSQDVLHK